MVNVKKKISVCIATYNQEKYIERAVQSILMQKTTCEVEIIIGDDASTDRNVEILKRLRDEHPTQIKLLLHEHNLGNRGGNNFLNALEECHGDYIATLDGDDFWSSPDKLQKQFEFLEASPDFALCFHETWGIVDMNESDKILYIGPPHQDELTLADLCKYYYFHTSSCFFRGNLLVKEELNDWLKELRQQDWALHIYLARFGKIKFLKDIYSTYRLNSQGTWTSSTNSQRVQDNINVIHHLNGKLNKAFEAEFGYNLAGQYHVYLSMLLEEYLGKMPQGLKTVQDIHLENKILELLNQVKKYAHYNGEIASELPELEKLLEFFQPQKIEVAQVVT
ncbi:MAG: glycosyltransferase [Cyanobacteria bacterium]|nr:glycosyltransferase [Cyanobacteriota bacterium]